MMKKMLILIGLLLLLVLVVSCVREGAVAGEVVRGAAPRCNSRETCERLFRLESSVGNLRSSVGEIGVRIEELEAGPILIPFTAIRDHYGDESYRTTKTAEDVCGDMGYTACFAGEFVSERLYFESTTNACTSRQLVERDVSLKPCSWRPTPLSGCLESLEGVSEPEYGDTKFTAYLDNVICFE